MKKAFIMKALRTPIGSFGGKLSALSATDLGGLAIKAVVQQSRIPSEKVEHVYMGNVLSANLGQAPARQAALAGGLPVETEATTLNKVCSSGIKAITLAATSLMAGKASVVVVAGGMESMSNVPFYLPQNRFTAQKLGHPVMVDGLLKDGLWDVYHDYHMGNAAEHNVRLHQISRQEQDNYTVASYQKAITSTENKVYSPEIITVEVGDAKGTRTLVDLDEDVFKVKFDKIPLLQPVFEPGGTITAANASNLNDGAAAVLLAAEEALDAFPSEPMAEILDFEDASQAQELFCTSPAVAIRRLLDRNGLKVSDISFFEINEAYASVVLANAKLLRIPLEKINPFGGAVALGHPIGASGARIVVTLLNVLKQRKGELGIAAICNGGGGSTAVLVKNLQA
jgi:acetyl-CoA C-acetyltransferase